MACVNLYRKLNRITKPFEFQIPICDDAISSVGAGSRKILIISIATRESYHQVLVTVSDREKLVFFVPENQKYALCVIPLVPTNAPGFFLAMKNNFKDKWEMIFIQLLRELKTIKNEPVVVTETDEIFIRMLKLVSGNCTIIDDILIFCRNIDEIILYLECLCRVFQKYCVSFWSGKCDILKDIIEYVGHDVTE